MSRIALTIEGIAFWGNGLPNWDAARLFSREGAEPESAPRRPIPALLPPNERRRAPDTVALALDVAQAACAAARRDPATLASVFTSTHGDLAITDYMCSTLVTDPKSISPTRFHNSVHNAAAGYWTIGVGAHAPATALSAYSASFAQGLIEAAAQIIAGEPAVLLVAYDGESCGTVDQASRSRCLLAAALVLCAGSGEERRVIELEWRAGSAAASDGGRLTQRFAENAMAPMLPFFDALAMDDAASIRLCGGRHASLCVDLRSAS